MNEKILNEGNQIHNVIFSSGSGTVTNNGSGSDFLISYRYGSDSGSTSQKVTVPTVPVPVPQCCEKASDPNVLMLSGKCSYFPVSNLVHTWI